jgi:SAM-dependent methyltransferase
MSQPGPRFWQLFFEVYDHLPRQGPGSRACTARALALCRDLPDHPAILDLGCGSGTQTIHLAELTPGSIVAVDRHAPSIERLQAVVAEQGLEHRVRPVVGDMSDLGPGFGAFDLVWSEGALYSIGLRAALAICHDVLRPGGYLAFTDAIWRRADPPPPVRASFDLDYPTMGRLEDDLAAIEACGLTLVGHFTLPDDAWWDDFYTPMQARIAEVRGVHAGDAGAEDVLAALAAEPELHRRYSTSYAYEFFVARRA